MKFLLLFLPLLVPVIMIDLFAQSYIISSIPLPKSYIQDLDPYQCNKECLTQYLNEEQIFSYLSHINNKNTNDAQKEQQMIYISLFNLGGVIEEQDLKIALLLPSKVIGRYALSTTNSVFSYLLAKNSAFKVQSYQIESESLKDLKDSMQQIKDDGFNYVIAPLTKEGAKNLVALDPKINVYIPTINKKIIASHSSYIYFGGIDYEVQLDALMEFSKTPLVIFYDDSSFGKELNVEAQKSYLKLDTDQEFYSYAITKKMSNLKKQLQGNKKLEKSSCLLNTPIVKSSMILSQLTLYDTNSSNILSTQINYDPLLFSMTQYQDRKSMLITNSITQHNSVLIDTNTLLNNDIVYDWINYSTTIGVDFFYHLMSGNEREYTHNLLEHQVIYPTSLVQPTFSKFEKLY